MQVTPKQQIIMEEKINIASWNLRLGLMNKKDYVSQMIISNKIDKVNPAPNPNKSYAIFFLISEILRKKHWASL